MNRELMQRALDALRMVRFDGDCLQVRTMHAVKSVIGPLSAALAAPVAPAEPLDHVCGLQGFGAPGDVCPACRAWADGRNAPVSPAGDKPAMSREDIAEIRKVHYRTDESFARAIIAARDAQWAARLDAAVRDEREVCANAASDFLTSGRSPLGKRVADAIRARTKEKT